MKNKTRGIAIASTAHCWSHVADLIYFFLILYELFVQDQDWIAVGTIQQCRLGIGYEKALQEEEEGVERAGKKRYDNIPIESTEMKIFWIEVSDGICQWR